MHPTPPELTPLEQLTAALRLQALGDRPAQAANYMVERAGWLSKEEFRPYIEYVVTQHTANGESAAHIRWREAITALDSGDLSASPADEQLLRIAASIGGGVPVDLRTNLSHELGDELATLIRQAIEHTTTE